MVRRSFRIVSRCAPMRTIRALFLVPVVAVLASCATNPVTGESELSLIGEQEEIQMGREADRQVVSSMGLVENAELAALVDETGQALAAVSERPDLPWTFRIIDDPTVNAFALPGGFVYVTRGMLAHLESEAQLAGILGHEIGHVTARHSVNQLSRQQLASLGLGLGMVLVPELRQFDQIAGLGMQLLFLKFGRDDERQSDELGVEYMTQLGYDPAELADVFGLLARKSQDEGGALPAWASTHPQPGERQSTILALADRYPAAETVERDAYLTRLDGLVFGDDPRNGFFKDGVFHHPELTFRFALPRGWQGLNGDQAVQLMGPEQDVIMVLQLAEASDPRAAAERFAGQEGVQIRDTRSASIHGLDAYWVDFIVETSEGTLAGRAAFPRVDGRVYAFYGFSAAGRWGSHQGTVTDVLGSFQRETDPAVLAVTPDRIDVLSLDHALSVRDFVREYQVATDAATVALINQVWDTERLEPGWVKRVVS